MGKKRAKITEADVARWISQGHGQGEEAGYVPWIRRQDIPSKGRVSEVRSTKFDRNHHLLSKLEYSFFLIADYSRLIYQIREQFPFSRELSLSVAADCGIKHPVYERSNTPVVITTDFLLDVYAGNGKTKRYSRSTKYAKDLKSPRTKELLELDRRTNLACDIDWKLVTEKDIPAQLVSNLDWIHQGCFLPKKLGEPEIQYQFLEILAYMDVSGKTLRAVLSNTAKKLSLNLREATALFKHLAWYQYILIDLNIPLGMTKPLNELVVEEFSNTPIAEKECVSV